MTVAAAVPRPRSPAQIEAARRNGARSKGPDSPEGKVRSSRNALQHGLAALCHLVLESEDPAELEELTARLLAELGPAGELEVRLVRRLAVAFWKGERAERLEATLLDAAPRLKPPLLGGTWTPAAPEETFDVKRFNAVRGYQAQQGRKISRCLKELRQLRREPLTDADDAPDVPLESEPEAPDATLAPAVDDEPETARVKLQNEPGTPAPKALPQGDLERSFREEIAAQTAAEEPDVARLLALTRRRFGLERVSAA